MSALLAVLESVHEFARAILGPLGAPAGKVTTFIEVPFMLGDRQVRPDGLIHVVHGKREWTALVEVKTGRNDLATAQLETYLDLGRERGFDVLLTISNQIATAPGEHPTPLDRKKLKKVGLKHLSWSQIHTEAVIERVNRSVADPDQAWILSELIRYLEHPRSGAVDFDDMGASWVAVRDGATNGTLRAGDKAVAEVAGRFGQLVAFSGLRLSRKLGVEVRPALTRSELQDSAKRVQEAATALVTRGTLHGALRVPNAIAPIDITADLRAGRVDCAVSLSAPSQGRPTTRINWILRQLAQAPLNLLIEAVPAWAHTGPCHTLADVRQKPQLLVSDPAKEIRTFVLRLSAPAGIKRGQGRGSFVGSVLDTVDRFYGDVVQHLKPWSVPAPTVKPTSPLGTDQGLSDDITGQLPPYPRPADRAEQVVEIPQEPTLNHPSVETPIHPSRPTAAGSEGGSASADVALA